MTNKEILSRTFVLSIVLLYLSIWVDEYRFKLFITAILTLILTILVNNAIKIIKKEIKKGEKND